MMNLTMTTILGLKAIIPHSLLWVMKNCWRLPKSQQGSTISLWNMVGYFLNSAYNLNTLNNTPPNSKAMNKFRQFNEIYLQISDPSMDPSQRALLIQNSIKELQKTYKNLKSNLVRQPFIFYFARILSCAKIQV